MGSYRYLQADEVLPRDLLEACKDALGRQHAVISFQPPASPSLNVSESRLLHRSLVECVRERLTRDDFQNRCLYFRGEGNVRPPDLRRARAEALVAAGFSAQTVSDVLGIARPTVSRWCPVGEAVRPCPEPGSRDLGLAVLAERFGVGSDDPVEVVRALAARLSRSPGYVNYRARMAAAAVEFLKRMDGLKWSRQLDGSYKTACGTWTITKQAGYTCSQSYWRLDRHDGEEFAFRLFATLKDAKAYACLPHNRFL